MAMPLRLVDAGPQFRKQAIKARNDRNAQTSDFLRWLQQIWHHDRDHACSGSRTDTGMGIL
ncbi:hypothetical protein GCM10007094_32080 [Pseudovibrio japonicus]|uniref:Uncharacterized protein n=1 Tax=Pseudovibrio japonicus TaxID=366534 RepID=A0ABQ3ELK0_9HYPH|nr:hypothetical protein GCM10007094_32080 [Pseudovibrio japonicus]